MGLLEKKWNEFRKIYTPVAPNVAAIGLQICILVFPAVKDTAQGSVVFIQEIRLAYSYPKEFWVL